MHFLTIWVTKTPVYKEENIYKYFVIEYLEVYANNKKSKIDKETMKIQLHLPKIW
jgi:hypothetical protein